MNNKSLICVVSLIVIIAGLGCISQPDSSQPVDKDNENNGNAKDIGGLWLGSLEVSGGSELRILGSSLFCMGNLI